MRNEIAKRETLMGDVAAFVNLLILSERGTKEQSDKVKREEKNGHGEMGTDSRAPESHAA